MRILVGIISCIVHCFSASPVVADRVTCVCVSSPNVVASLRGHATGTANVLVGASDHSVVSLSLFGGETLPCEDSCGNN